MKKVALITGTSSGIGKAIAGKLHEEGWTVYGTVRRFPEPAEKAPFPVVIMDVREDESVKKGVSKVLEQEEQINLLVNNAGIGLLGVIEEVPSETVKNVYETNVFGILRVSREVIPVMRKQRSGMIINISSIAGQMGLPFQGIYSSSKFAVEGISEAMRMELRPFGIKVCTIQPGDIKTGIGIKRQTIRKTGDSPYAENISMVEQVINRNVQDAHDPEIIARLVLKITRKRKPSFRYRKGTILETIAPLGRTILPYSFYERVVRFYYHIK